MEDGRGEEWIGHSCGRVRSGRERASEPNNLSTVERDYYVLRKWREIMRRYLGCRAQWLRSSALPPLTQPLVCLGWLKRFDTFVLSIFVFGSAGVFLLRGSWCWQAGWCCHLACQGGGAR